MSANDKVREVLDADRRLVILRLLRESGLQLNSSVLEKSVRAWGFRTVDRHMIKGDVDWLRERSLVETEQLSEEVLLVKITSRGERVARDEESVPGVARPS